MTTMNLFSPSSSSTKKNCNERKEEESTQVDEVAKVSASKLDTASFEGLGLSEWICQNIATMGFRNPTPVQAECVPAILQGHDVIGCAETGSGKTAAFALPILQHLSLDPYGIFAIVLTPTRELAVQIAEQFAAFGAPIGLRQTLIIGGENMTEQSLALKRLPHVVIATPGRLRHHLEGPDPPSLARTPYLVLDEADRLLARGFSSELDTILSSMSSPKRKTFLFSATMTASLAEVEKLAMKDALKFDLTMEQRVPAQLVQEYLFMPSQVKMAYLVVALNKLLKRGILEDDKDLEEEEGGTSYASKSNHHKKGKKGDSKKKYKKNNPEDALALALSAANADDDLALNSNKSHGNIIIFAGTCRKCQETHETLRELGFDTVVLHGMMTQQLRSTNLGKFKNQQSRILIATDVASRGLDIPEVELVVNLDLPRVAEDYVHRVGRTARAGKKGRTLALVTQFDVEILQGIEEYMGLKLIASDEVTEEEVVPLLNGVSKATRLAQLKMLESGFDEKDAGRKEMRASKGKKNKRAEGRDRSRDTEEKSSKKNKMSAKELKGGKGVPRDQEMSNVMRM